MGTLEAFQIIGLYFQHHTDLEMGIGKLLVRQGIGRYPFHGVVSFLVNHESSMVDSLGPAKLSDFWEEGERGWGYTKQYAQPRSDTKKRIMYRFTELSEDGSYWVGDYRVENADAWGEAHAILRPISLDEADRLIRWHEAATKTVVLDETMREFESYPREILHLTRLPQVFDHGDNGVLPELESQDPDVQALCKVSLFHDHTLPEAWVEVYCFVNKMAERLNFTWNEVVQRARSRIEREGSLLKALQAINFDIAYEDKMQEMKDEQNYFSQDDDDSE